MDGAESELESFRKQWREEVSARLRPTGEGQTGRKHSARGPARPQKQKKPPQSSHTPLDSISEPLQYEDQGYHDLEDKEDPLKLGNASSRSDAGAKTQELHSALEHYEKAVEKEDEGRLGDSVNLYRKALRLDSSVHEIYKDKHFPAAASSSQPTELSASKPPAIVSGTTPEPIQGPSASISELLDEFSLLSIPPASPETDLSPSQPCPIAAIPAELLREIYIALAFSDVASFARLALVCKRFAFLVMTEEPIWKLIALGNEYGMAAMHYSYACDLNGLPLLHSAPNNLLGSISYAPLDLTPSTYATYRSQFRHRPRIRFNGCYISTVNYTRPGAASQSQITWNSPIHIVTYYRYLRFFRDGTVISLLSTAEPADVVHHLLKENMHNHHTGTLPSAVMKDALSGRWRLSGRPSLTGIDMSGTADHDKGPGEYTRETLDAEDEGFLFVETEGVVPKYMWKMEFAIGSAGRKDGPRNNKLTWRGFWSYNRLADDWGEFRLKNDKAFYWSRVKSYGTGQ